MSEDRLILGTACGGDFRVIAAQTTNALETARLRCDLSPVAASALGRALTSAALLARLLVKQFAKRIFIYHSMNFLKKSVAQSLLLRL